VKWGRGRRKEEGEVKWGRGKGDVRVSIKGIAKGGVHKANCVNGQQIALQALQVAQQGRRHFGVGGACCKASVCPPPPPHANWPALGTRTSKGYVDKVRTGPSEMYRSRRVAAQDRPIWSPRPYPPPPPQPHSTEGVGVFAGGREAMIARGRWRVGEAGETRNRGERDGGRQTGDAMEVVICR